MRSELCASVALVFVIACGDYATHEAFVKESYDEVALAAVDQAEAYFEDEYQIRGLVRPTLYAGQESNVETACRQAGCSCLCGCSSYFRGDTRIVYVTDNPENCETCPVIAHEYTHVVAFWTTGDWDYAHARFDYEAIAKEVCARETCERSCTGLTCTKMCGGINEKI